MDHSLYFKEPPHESLWLIFDCSLNTIQEIFSIIDMLRSVPYPENEIIESLSNIRFSDLTMNQLKYIHGKVKWSEKTEYLALPANLGSLTYFTKLCLRKKN